MVLSSEHKMIQETAQNFAHQVLLPTVIERDKNGSYPTEEVQKMAEMGFLGMMVDPTYQGGGMDTLSYVIAMQEIAKVDASAAVIMSVNNSLVCWGIEKFGSEAQKEKYLPKLATGESIGAFCLSEPEAGSDATQQRTIAEFKENHYLINGVKNWITNGKTANVYIVIAQSNPSLGHKGINAFIVDADSPGITTSEKEDKMGIRSSDTCSIQFNNVKVPTENRIGPEGFGFELAMKTLEGGRIGIAAQALGIGMGAFERSLDYAKSRITFGQPLIKHQDIAFKLSDMATRLEAAKLLVYKAALDKDAGIPYKISSSKAKLYAAETAMYVTEEAVQIHGGYGYVREYHVERMMRDAKITQIYEGTSQIQKLIIARSL